MPDHRAQLSHLLDASGLSIVEASRTIFGRDERTVRRWLTGAIEIPDSVAAWLARVSVETEPETVTITVARHPRR